MIIEQLQFDFQFQFRLQQSTYPYLEDHGDGSISLVTDMIMEGQATLSDKCRHHLRIDQKRLEIVIKQL